MSSHLVERSEEDSFTAVSHHIGDLLNEEEDKATSLANSPGSQFASDCEALIGEGRFSELLSQLLSKSEVLFSRAQNKDLECCLHVICHLVGRIPDVGSAAQSVAQILTAKADDHPDLRLSALTQLFNIVTDAMLQFNVLLELLRFSIASGQASALVPVIRVNMDSWPTDLKLSSQQTRTLYQLAADVLRSSKRMRKSSQRDAYKLTLKLLESVDSAPDAEVAECKAAAATAASDFVKSPDLFQFDLLEAPAVQQLRGDSEHGPLFELLSLMLSGSVQEFEAFASKNSSLFEATGISQADAVAKMRLMALLGLVAQSNTVSFSDVREALDIEEDAVETWVIKAIGKKLLDARIDQLSGTIAITRATHRSFGQPQWAELRDRLASWKANVGNVRAMVADHVASGSIPPALQQAIRA